MNNPNPSLLILSLRRLRHQLQQRLTRKKERAPTKLRSLKKKAFLAKLSRP